MGQKNRHLDKILWLLYEHPEKAFTVREIAKHTKIPKSSVQQYLQDLKKQHFVNAENKIINSLLMKIKKINHFVEKIVSSGLLECLIAELNPSCIILFGSIRKGESVKESDIDIFVESALKKKLKLTSFEKELAHSIQLFVEPDIHNLPPQLFNNVVNGIKLYGSFKVKK